MSAALVEPRQHVEEAVVPEVDDVLTDELGLVECVSVEDILTAIGFWNLYTIYMLVSFGMIWTFASMAMMVGALVASGPLCADGELECHNISLQIHSVRNQFNLSKEVWWQNPEWMTSAFFVGNAIGGPTLSFVSDRIGRLKVISPSLFCLGLFGTCSYFAPNYCVFLAFRFAQGLFYTGSMVISFVLVCESLSFLYHPAASLVFGMCWVVGYLAVAPLVMLLLSWDKVMLCISIPASAYSVFLWFGGSESFEYMLMSKRYGNAERFIDLSTRRMWRKCLRYDLEMIGTELVLQKSGKDMAFFETMRSNRRLLISLLIAMVIWMSNVLIYEGLSYLSTNLARNPYFAYALSGLVEIPSYICGPVMLSRLGRKPTMIITHILTGGLLLMIVPVPRGAWHTAISMIAKLSATCSFTCLFVFSSEIFPLSIRTTCMGLCALASDIGAMIAPHCALLNRLMKDFAFGAIGVLSLVAATATYFLPGTKRECSVDDALSTVRSARTTGRGK